MWLLKLHFSISVLCLLTFLGFRMVYKEQIKGNGYVPSEKKKKGISFYFIFFVPILNLLSVLVLLMMIAMKKENLEKSARNGKMRVQMADKIYEMNSKQYKGFLKVAKSCLPVGVYAIEKDGVAIMMNEKPKDGEDLRKQVEVLEKEGFKVYWNGF